MQVAVATAITTFNTSPTDKANTLFKTGVAIADQFRFANANALQCATNSWKGSFTYTNSAISRCIDNGNLAGLC